MYHDNPKGPRVQNARPKASGKASGKASEKVTGKVSGNQSTGKLGRSWEEGEESGGDPGRKGDGKEDEDTEVEDITPKTPSNRKLQQVHTVFPVTGFLSRVFPSPKYVENNRPGCYH